MARVGVEMDEYGSISNRDIAVAFWLTVLLLAACTTLPGRKALSGVLRSLREPKVIGIISIYGAYLTFSLVAASKIGLWQWELLKDVIIWFFFSGVAMLLGFDEAGKDSRYVQKKLKSIFGVAVFYGFFVNIATFSIPVEIVVQFFIAMVVLAANFMKREPKNKDSIRVFEFALACFGVYLCSHTVAYFIRNWDDTDTLLLARSLALGFWMPVAALPFVAFFSRYAAYSSLFNRMKYANNKREPGIGAKIGTVLTLRGSYPDINGLNIISGRALSRSKSVRQAMANARAYKRARREAQSADQEKLDRLIELAGSKGTNQDGTQIDQREFEETKRALDSLHLFQMGWFRNGKGYRADLADIMSDYSLRGLPSKHGVQLLVSDDKQAYRAWRRTVTGWVFGIGARDGKPEKWVYDGPEPPDRFPEEDAKWDLFGSQGIAKNWK